MLVMGPFLERVIGSPLSSAFVFMPNPRQDLTHASKMPLNQTELKSKLRHLRKQDMVCRNGHVVHGDGHFATKLEHRDTIPKAGIQLA